MITRPERLLIAAAVFASCASIAGSSWLAIGASVVVVALFIDGIFRPQSNVFVKTFSHGPRSGRRVALTFDDGPSETTPAILDALASGQARATFFCIGRHLEAHRDIALRAIREGHELGNHSFAHSRLLNFSGAGAMQREIERGASAVRALTQKDPLYRPPIGLKNPPLARVAARIGLSIVAWSLHARDTGITEPEAIARRVLSKIRPGDIVLLHDGCDRDNQSRRATAEALPLILRGLKEKGLESTTVSELLRRA